MTHLIVLQLEGNSLTVPEGVPIYDLQTDIPWFFENHTPWTDLVKRTLETNPELVQLLMSPEQPTPYPEAKSILRWETNMVRTAHECWLRHKTSLHRCNAQKFGIVRMLMSPHPKNYPEANLIFCWETSVVVLHIIGLAVNNLCCKS